ncbi:hypothetical protein HMPREF1546_00988 [Oscillibacter sp. KLE 1745]|nr:hypothetical protein HMPREF1546_00988 [Oscillibacter sp. KLE 1745]
MIRRTSRRHKTGREPDRLRSGSLFRCRASRGGVKETPRSPGLKRFC